LTDEERYARPSTSPSSRKAKKTLCPECMMIPNHVDLNRLLGRAYKSDPSMAELSMPHGWCQ
jgi:hypothetical protein